RSHYIMQLPSAIIFVNTDINDTLQSKLEVQLDIHNTMSGDDFDSIITNDPSYVEQSNLNGLRILVIRDYYNDTTNRDLADVVMFVSHGIIDVEYNKYGPPAKGLRVYDINIFSLLRAAESNKVTTLPNLCSNCNTRSCNSNCSCNCGAPFYHPYDPSGVLCSDESHYTNADWLNRR